MISKQIISSLSKVKFNSHLLRSYSTTVNNSGNSFNKVLYNDKEFYQEEKYVGISKEPFSKEISDVLLSNLDPQDIEIKPDGLIYLPEIKYRRILNTAFGPGGWALKPFGPPVVDNGSLIRPYALYCLGRYISESIGEQPYNEDLKHLSFATATESAKSNALVRCCKDIGIGSSLWDPIFIRQWKSQYAQEKFFEHVKSKEKRKFWILKNGHPNQIGYPWKEVDFNSSEPSNPSQETTYENKNSSYSKNTYETKPPKSTTNVPQQEFLSSTSASPTPKQPQQQESTSTVQEQEIDIDDVVPSKFKKYEGKTWRELIADPKGEQYIEWASQNFSDPNIRLQSAAILEFFRSSK
ncbi:mitochondrial genome maintenance protein [Tieghemostelium lacteum]|uniref:Mitochondrial genome maintenance protein n=1 Tax=Tieghemostelium lacteum TaxID=361077 RepID=A0A152A0B0_TIELA|nr:mitochondrial genome maintenance protein [Tieghemostelium lacteum]|eukprot:KYQ99649.1 mitochondrial genome maintenance protein [Tieghemostelium lacteum]